MARNEVSSDLTKDSEIRKFVTPTLNKFRKRVRVINRRSQESHLFSVFLGINAKGD